MCVRVNAPVYQLNLKCTCVSRSGSWNEGMGLPGAVANITLEMENLSNRGMYCIGENRPLENHSMKTQSFGNCFFSTSFQIGKKNTWAFEISHGSLTRELKLTLCLPVFALAQLQQCIAVSRKASEKIFQFYRDSVRRRYSKMLEWGACDAFILCFFLTLVCK